jgi:hypothetical protein
VNCVHYIKCGVNSSLHNSGCCIRSVAPWITVLTRHTVFTKRLIYYKFTFVRYSTKQGTRHRPMSHLAHCVPFLWPQEEHGSAQWLVFSLASVSWGDLLGLTDAVPLFLLRKIFFPIPSLCTRFPESVMQPNLTVGCLFKFYLFFPAIARYAQSSALFRLLCMTRHSSRNVNHSDMRSSTVTAKQV